MPEGPFLLFFASSFCDLSPHCGSFCSAGFYACVFSLLSFVSLRDRTIPAFPSRSRARKTLWHFPLPPGPACTVLIAALRFPVSRSRSPSVSDGSSPKQENHHERRASEIHSNNAVRRTEPRNTILEGDCTKLLRRMPAGRADFVLTDPPYLVRATARATAAPSRTTPMARGSCPRLPKSFASCRAMGSASASTAGRKPTASLPHGAARGSGSRSLLVSEGVRFDRAVSALPPRERLPAPQGQSDPARGADSRCHRVKVFRQPAASDAETAVRLDAAHPVVLASRKSIGGSRNGWLSFSRHGNRELCSGCPGGLVVDPFCGSGSTLLAAKLAGRRFLGIEFDANYCAIARRRLFTRAA